MNLPDDVSVAISYEGLSFELRVGALRQGCVHQFPDLQAADEVFAAPCLPAAVVQAAASALDAAVAQFRSGFQASLSMSLEKYLDDQHSADHEKKEAA